MALRRRPAGPAPPPEPARDFEVTIVTDAEQHPRSWLTIAASAVVAIVLVAIAVPALLAEPGRPAHSVRHSAPRSPTPIASEGPGEPGRDAIAFAFRGPLRCAALEFAPSDQSYARAISGHGGACVDGGANRVTVFHQIAHEWRLVLSTTTYSCPVGALPALVQLQLRVCPKRDASLF